MMQTLQIEERGHVRVATLIRPDKRNALSATLVEALLAALEAAAKDGVRLFCLRGAGKNFSAGFDFNGYETESEGDLLLRFVRIECLLQALAHAPFETMALAHGPNFGAGVDIIAACTQRILAPGAQFMMPGLRFGLVLGTRRYAALVGTARARRVLNDGIVFTAEEALQDGFATGLADPESWDARIAQAGEMAARLRTETASRLLALTGQDTRADDLAELVRSAATPGLKGRIHAYRAA